MSQGIGTSLEQRTGMRIEKKYGEADALRSTIITAGYEVHDRYNVTEIQPKTRYEQIESKWPSVSASREIDSLLDEPTSYEYSFILNACIKMPCSAPKHPNSFIAAELTFKTGRSNRGIGRK